MQTFSPKLLITGGNGQLATALCQHEKVRNFALFPCSSEKLDITQPTDIANALSTIQPDYVINTAAYTAVDNAELHSDHAMSVNYLGAKLLALACDKNNIPLLHVSTDYVFDGNKKQPYREEDETNPLNVYGKSKLLGEQAVRNYCQHHLILRVSGVFSSHGNNFLKTILRLATEKKELRIVVDQITCPTYAGDIAGVIFSLLQHKLHGTYHFCGADAVSWHQFALLIIEHAKQQRDLLVETVLPIPANAYQSVAKRPLYSVLDCSKLLHDATIQQPSLQTAVQRALQEYHHVLPTA